MTTSILFPLKRCPPKRKAKTPLLKPPQGRFSSFQTLLWDLPLSPFRQHETLRGPEPSPEAEPELAAVLRTNPHMSRHSTEGAHRPMKRLQGEDVMSFGQNLAQICL